MRKRPARNKIIFLAYLHRYVYPIMVIVLPMLIGMEYALLGIGIGFLLLALYDLVGYILRWKHIYCSHQEAHREKMTPDDIKWHTIKKSEAFGLPAIGVFMGITFINVYFICRP